MIHKKNIALVIDTNILVDILDTVDSENLYDVLKKWILRILDGMDRYPVGKKITVFASTDIIHDYKTGLSRKNHKAVSRTLKMVFDRSTSHRIPISEPHKIYLSLRKIPTTQNKPKRRIQDKYDKNFLLLCEEIRKSKHWSDFEILFASRDHQLFLGMTNAFPSGTKKRPHIVDSLILFEKLIAC